MLQEEKNKILVIGNGESVLNKKLGSKIDDFDCIARINNYKINKYKEYIGSKTSIWFNGANQGLYKREDKPGKVIVFIPSIIQEKKDDCNQIVKSRLGTKDFHLVKSDKIKSYERECDHNRLTTGTYAILWSIENFRQVYIYGFDFFINSKSHYFDNKIISTLKNKGVIPKAKKHDMYKEKAYIDNLLLNGKLKILNG